MNLSNVSVYENVYSDETFSKSQICRTISDLLSLNGNVEVKLFCPLCVSNFGCKFSLFEHLRTFHNNFLTQAGNNSLSFIECPFCDAKFYGKHLTARHALTHHSKVIRELFSGKKKSGKCSYCNATLPRKDSKICQHIEDLHFLEYEEEFFKVFSCNTGLDMTISELINTSKDESSWEYVCVDVGDIHSARNKSDTKDFTEASRMNCYDFTELKEQLENIKDFESSKKPILTDKKNLKQSPSSYKSVRRVLRFDLPQTEEDKENYVLQNNLKTFKKINLNEHQLLCQNSKKELENIFTNDISSLCEDPQHSSTPNSSCFKGKSKIGNLKEKSRFKLNITHKTPSKYEFQCGKCRKLFRENFDLVSHVKTIHKKFNLNVLQPCYRCAICNARFYKNYYLRKHHILHKPN